MTRFFNPDSICKPLNPYSHGAEIDPGTRLVYFSGQIGADIDGHCHVNQQNRKESSTRLFKQQHLRVSTHQTH